jgi:ketosteroid isomerase-like protein
MRKLGAFGIVALLSLGLFASQPSQAAGASIVDQIKALEDQVTVAYIANDLPKYFSFYAADLRAVYPEGMTTLPEYQKSWGEFVKSGGAILNFVISDMQVQVGPSNDVAVASYQAAVRTKNPGKDPVDEKYNETDVWFKRGAKWQIVEIHYSAAGQ